MLGKFNHKLEKVRESAKARLHKMKSSNRGGKAPAAATQEAPAPTQQHQLGATLEEAVQQLERPLTNIDNKPQTMSIVRSKSLNNIGDMNNSQPATSQLPRAHSAPSGMMSVPPCNCSVEASASETSYQTALSAFHKLDLIDLGSGLSVSPGDCNLAGTAASETSYHTALSAFDRLDLIDLNRAMSLAPCDYNVEASAASETNSYKTAVSSSHKFDLDLTNSNSSRPGSTTSTMFFSAASASPAPSSSSSRAASPDGSSAADGDNWTILAGCTPSSPSGIFSVSKEKALHAKSESVLEESTHALGQKPMDMLLYKMPLYIDSTNLPPLPSGHGFAYVYDLNHNGSSTIPRTDSPEVGCFSGLGGRLSSLIHRPKKTNSAATTVVWEPSTSTNSKGSQGRQMIKKLVQARKALKANHTGTTPSEPSATTTNKVSLSLGKKMIQQLAKTRDTIMAEAKKARKAIKAEAQATCRSLSSTWGSATNSVSNSFRSLGGSLGGGIDSATAGLRRTGSSMGGALESAGSSFKQRLSTAGSSVGDVFEKSASGIKRGVSSVSTSLGGVLDEVKVASDQAVNHLAIKLTISLTALTDKLKALEPMGSFRRGRSSSQGGACCGSEVVVGRGGSQWGIVVSPEAAAPTAMAA